MRKVLVNLNQNLITLTDQFAEMIQLFYQKRMRKLVEGVVARGSKLFFDVLDAVEHLRFEKAISLLLQFLDEVEALMDDAAWRVALKPFERITHVVRELLQVIRTQIIFIDQYRQSNFAF